MSFPSYTKTAPIGWGDADVQNQQVMRQRAMADMLRQQSQAVSKGQMIGNRYVAPSWTEQLGKVLSGYASGQIDKKADARQEEIAGERRRMMSEALGGFQKNLSGTPEQTIPADENPWTSTPEQTIPAKPGDAGAAYAGLMQSGIPELQQMGMSGTLETAKTAAATQRAQAMAKQLQTAPSAQAAIAAGIDPKMVEAYFKAPLLGKEELVPVNGQLVGKLTGKPVGDAIPKQEGGYSLAPGATRFGPDGKPVVSVTDFNKPFGPDGAANQPFQDFSLSRAKAGAPKMINDNRNFATQESEQSKKYGAGLGEIRTNITQAGFDAPAKLAQLSRLEQLLDGVDGGKAAPLLADVASVAQSFGIKLDPKMGVKQAAEAVAREMAGSFRKPGTGPMTDKDFDNFLRQVPDLSKSAEGRKQITQTMRAAVERDLRASQHARDYAKKNGGVIDDNYFDSLAQFYADNPVVKPAMPAGGSSGRVFKVLGPE